MLTILTTAPEELVTDLVLYRCSHKLIYRLNPPFRNSTDVTFRSFSQAIVYKRNLMCILMERETSVVNYIDQCITHVIDRTRHIARQVESHQTKIKRKLFMHLVK